MDDRPSFAEEVRSLVAVTHLAIARSQKTRTGILGNTKEKSSLTAAFYVIGKCAGNLVEFKENADGSSKIYMRNKSQRMQIKLIAILFGVVVLIVLLIANLIGNSREKKKEAYIPMEDVVLLTKALYPPFAESKLYAEWGGEKDRTVGLQYRQYEQLLTYLEEESKLEGEFRETLTLPDYKRTYHENENILTEDWYTFFHMIKPFFDPNETITEDSIVVLGTEENTTDGNGVPLTNGSLLSAAGYVYQYENSGFTNSLYKTLQVLKRGNELLCVLEKSEIECTLKNTWVKEVKEEEIYIFVKGYNIKIPKTKEIEIKKEEVADIVIAEGSIGDAKSKTEKFSGKLVRVADGKFEIEGHGEVETAKDIKVYKLFGSLEECRVLDLIIGYDFTDFVVEDGVICAALITRDGTIENIRVLLKNSGFSTNFHEQIVLTADTEFDVICGESTVTHPAGELITILPDDVAYAADRIYIKPKALTGQIAVSSIQRDVGTPTYRGILEIEKVEEGFVLINELLLEEYLYAVVPSEMPASYPKEALKAQAVGARTYAYKSMINAGLGQYGAHVDDSTSYQVYHNIEESMETTTAVKETKGQVMQYGETLAGAYYYSTSCGYGTNACVWNGNNKEDFPYLQAKQIAAAETVNAEQMSQEEVFRDYITAKTDVDYEKEEAWYRWQYNVEALDKELLLNRIKERYAVNENLILTKEDNSVYKSKEIEEIGTVKKIYVAKRLPGGVIDELVIEGSKAEIKVLSEYNVRYVLSDGNSKVSRQDGSEIGPSALLPSAFLIIEPSLYKEEVVGYSIIGGGYGHGVGMSQNGARNMAASALTYEQILAFFYQGIELKTVY